MRIIGRIRAARYLAINKGDRKIRTKAANTFHPKVALLASLAVAMVLTPASDAAGATAHLFQGAIAGADTPQGSLSGPVGVATAPSGAVYVEDSLFVDRFDAEGHYVSQIPAAYNTRCSPGWDAVDQSSEDLYVGGTCGGPVFKYDSSGNLVSSFGSGGVIGVPEVRGVAVDASGNLYVGSFGYARIFKFDSNGTPDPVMPEIGAGDLSNSLGPVAVSPSGDVYIDDFGRGGLVGFHADGSCINSCNTFDSHGPTGLAFDSSGNLYVSESGTEEVAVYDPSTNPPTLEETFGRGHLGPNTASVAVNGPTVYVTNSNQIAVFKDTVVPDVSVSAYTNLEPHSVTLHGHVDPAGAGNIEACRFEYGPTPSYGQSVQCSPGVPLEEGTDVSAALANLDPATVYHYRLDAGNAAGENSSLDQTLETPPEAPSVKGDFVSGVHSESAELGGQVDPGGASTEYHFEYGTSNCSVLPDPCVSVPASAIALGAGVLFHNVNMQISALLPGTTYHYRIVATNIVGTESAESTFTTFPFTEELKDACPNALARQQTGAALLLDCRAYELVSAANSGGYDVESDLVPGQTPYGGYPQASGAGGTSRVLYGVHHGAIPGVAGNPTNKGVDPYIATREGGGWNTTYVGVPANDPFASKPFSSGPSGASSSLETFVFGGTEGCSPCFEGGYTGVPVRLPNGELIQGMVASPSVTPPGPSAEPSGYIASDVSADGTHVIFGSTSQFAPGGNNETGDISIYDHDLKTNETQAISSGPSGAPLPCLQGVGTCHSPGDGDGIAELGISSDGSRVIVAQKVSTDAQGNNYWHLYMAVGDDSHTIDLTPLATHGVLYDGMTADGSKVFFTSTDQLAGGSDTDSSADVYEADVSQAGALTLTRLSTGEGTGNTDLCNPVANSNGAHWNTVGATDDCAAVAIGGGGGVASGDGSFYFLSPELLQVGHGIQNQPNLYMVRPGQTPQFVATLSPSDSLVLDAVKEAASYKSADFQVTPNGEFAVFTTVRPLNEYDNAGHSEVYRYNVFGGLDCASCNQANARATGNATLASNGSSLTSDGQVFFNSDDPLVLGDTDNRKDVYEWETNGVGNCQPGSPDFFTVTGDCLSLISAGSSPFDSSLLGVSADGTDAFFFTHDSLAVEDQNGPVTKIYDARTSGGFFKVPSPPPCAASDECHGPGSQAPESPEIRTVTGDPSNVSPMTCRTGFLEKHRKCVKKHHMHRSRHQRRHHHRKARRHD